eukprot:6191969-Pleurochrysis_carterae.AAC.2
MLAHLADTGVQQIVQGAAVEIAVSFVRGNRNRGWNRCGAQMIFSFDWRTSAGVSSPGTRSAICFQLRPHSLAACQGRVLRYIGAYIRYRRRLGV